jgi:flagellar assembly protein FliH
MAQRPKKFLFERSFDDPGKLYLPGERRRAEIEAAAVADAAAAMAKKTLPEATLPPPEPKISPEEKLKAELDAAREEGYVQGHTAALEEAETTQEAETTREHYVADAISMISSGLGKLAEQQQAAYGQLAEEAMRMVYAIVAKLLPPVAHHHASETIGEFVRQVLPLATSEPRLVVRAHSMIVEDLERRLQDVMSRSGFRGSFAVVADYELQPGDCRIDWDGGGADRDEVRIWRDIRAALASAFGDIDVEALDAAAKVEPAPPKMLKDTPEAAG